MITKGVLQKVNFVSQESKKKSISNLFTLFMLTPKMTRSAHYANFKYFGAFNPL